jgi:hypothetical protein
MQEKIFYRLENRVPMKEDLKYLYIFAENIICRSISKKQNIFHGKAIINK